MSSVPPASSWFRSAARRYRDARSHLVGGRAMVLATATRGWQLVSGLVSATLILRHFDDDLQGVYYAFAELLAVQVLFDLGLTGVLTVLASREWSAALGDTVGNDGELARRRIGGLLRDAGRWFAAMATLFCLVALPLGLVLLDKPGTDAFDWKAPWCVTVLLTGATIWLMPTIGVLEGRYVAAVNGFRMVQAVLGSLAVWGTILAGGTLWALAASAAVRLVCEATFVLVIHGPRAAALRRLPPVPSDDPLDWRHAVRPLQWRMAIQSLATYLATRTYTLVIFETGTLAEAGRMGMTWSVLLAIQAAGLAWLQARIPPIGTAVTAHEVPVARRLLRQTIAIALGTQAVGVTVLVGLLLLLRFYAPVYAERFLDIPTICVFGLSLAAQSVLISWSTYVRLYRIDPFVRTGMIGAMFLTAAVVGLGWAFGAAGIAAAHLATMAVINPILLIPVFRRELAVVEQAATDQRGKAE